MTTELFLFAENDQILNTQMEPSGSKLSDFVSGFVPGNPPQSNNPWKLIDASGAQIPLADPDGNRGYAISVTSAPEEIKMNLLTRMRAAAGDQGRSVGIEIAPNGFDLAPRGQHWCAGRGNGYHFGTRSAANRLINLQALRDAGLTGKNVNIVVVDQGVNSEYIESLGGNYGGGMIAEADGESKMPGQGKGFYEALRKRHGSMILRSLIEIAPNARIFDLPLIPRRIEDVGEFAWNAAWTKFLFLWLNPPADQSWVFVNAWGIVDRFAESVRGDYTNGPDHPLNWLVSVLGQFSDVVFAAGNNGQFCGDPRASGYDRGPGQSIFGANGLPDVLSVGAVRADGQWIGMSSQGPGPDGFGSGDSVVEKPDLCAPSWFTEDQDAGLRSGGTSAACAVAAGAVAALREGWSWANVSPTEMREILRASARKVSGSGWNARTGAGIIDLKAAIAMLIDRHGPPEPGGERS